MEGAILRRKKENASSDQVIFEIDRTLATNRSLMILRTPGNHKIPFNDTIFVIQVPQEADTFYFIEIQREECEGNQDIDRNISRKKGYELCNGTCLILDLTCGSVSSRGFLGRGVRLGISSADPKTLKVKYSEPLIVRTAAQWERYMKGNSASVSFHPTDTVKASMKIFIENSKL